MFGNSFKFLCNYIFIFLWLYIIIYLIIYTFVFSYVCICVDIFLCICSIVFLGLSFTCRAFWFRLALFYSISLLFSYLS